MSLIRLKLHLSIVPILLDTQNEILKQIQYVIVIIILMVDLAKSLAWLLSQLPLNMSGAVAALFIVNRTKQWYFIHSIFFFIVILEFRNYFSINLYILYLVNIEREFFSCIKLAIIVQLHISNLLNSYQIWTSLVNV